MPPCSFPTTVLPNRTRRKRNQSTTSPSVDLSSITKECRQPKAPVEAMRTFQLVSRVCDGSQRPGLRHTCATLLLKAGEPVHVVSERLGHSKVSMTMEVYAHVLPDMQQAAAGGSECCCTANHLQTGGGADFFVVSSNVPTSPARTA